jgi:hypothetical protein
MRRLAGAEEGTMAGAAAGPVRTHHHLAEAARFSPREIKRAVSHAQGFNAKVAVIITKGVGTMACAYLFTLIALISLPDILITAGVLPKSDVPHVLAKPGLILIVAWIAQTFIQLVLLSIIMVGQNVQSIAADARSANTYADAEAILDRLDAHTQGGIAEILDRLDQMAPTLKGAAGAGAGKPAEGSA